MPQSLELTHSMLRNYMRSFASFHGINSNDDNPNIFYNTRVELVEKYFHSNGTEHGWTLTLKRLVRTAENSSEVTWWTEVRGICSIPALTSYQEVSGRDLTQWSSLLDVSMRLSFRLSPG